MPRVLVIGAGPAGSLTALLLARGGLDVTIFEQHRFPRDKVCGECLSALGIEVLTRAGLAERLRLLDPVTLQRTLVHPMDGPTLEFDLPRPMWGLTRFELDRALLAAAVEGGAELHQPARCESIDVDRAGLVWRDLETNRVSPERADWIVLADGKRALPGSPPPLTGDFGIKAHFSDVNGPRDAIELFAGPGCYGGMAAVNGGLWNAAFSVPTTLIRAARGNVAAVFAAVVAQHPTLRRRLDGTAQVRPWLAAPLPRFAVQSQRICHLLDVGNAAAALEPVGGEGMGLALRSAELTATAVIAGADIGGLDALPQKFRQLWQCRRVACRGIAKTVTIPWLSDAIAPLMAANLPLVRSAFRWAGKAHVSTDQ